MGIGAEEPYRVAALQAAPSLLELLKVRPVLGRSFASGDSREGAGAVMMLGLRAVKNSSDPIVLCCGARRQRFTNHAIAPSSKAATAMPLRATSAAPGAGRSGH